ncbi:LysM peptidoglycan-binding domain-containing protein [Xanthomonas sp. GW]|uniref:LysM peptidoglycan-binding domain-containing protein n=1 Tax=unclassified Xanthomonas TaxID=2643310 RepID=UPI00163A12FF|nr:MULTISPECIES: LysM peptidoglycan-binding domain-containing protein [unclassified Xanthomonas]QNH15454.1 LysM peptidoglycan-binding domain-containing protein [Xanthomonas sp. SS]QNH19688.1 LysM peptidoglycan-binding domain-containing protein [Xanthomonas sp. GW]
MFNRLRTVVAVAMLTVATYAASASMAAEHPDTYVVRKGDTLWDIAGRFLGKPWLWPEIWQANPQVQNPHLIYPGDVLSLAYLDRVARATVKQGPRQDAPIDAIPLSDVEPFLKNLRVADSIDELPYVVGFEDNRLRATIGQVVYATGLSEAQVGQRYAVVRPTVRYELPRLSDDLNNEGRSTPGTGNLWQTFVAPDNKRRETLGYELAQVNIGTVTRVSADDSQATTLLLQDSAREVRAGDRLIAVQAQPYDLQFVPHPPSAQALEAGLRVLAVADAFSAAGPRDVIAISGGSREGIDNGTVVSLWRHGTRVNDRVHRPNTSRADDGFTGGRGSVALPDEYAAHAMVFRTFDKVSYALVMDGVKPTRIGYDVKHPDAR